MSAPTRRQFLGGIAGAVGVWLSDRAARRRGEIQMPRTSPRARQRVESAPPIRPMNYAQFFETSPFMKVGPRNLETLRRIQLERAGV